MGLLDNFFNKTKTKSLSGDTDWVDLQTGETGDQVWGDSQLLEQYQKSIYVFRCVKITAERVASNNFKLHRVKSSKGETEEVLAHPILSLLAKPNPFQTWDTFLKITETNKLLTGEAYWYKIYDNRGKLVELWNIRPDLIKAVHSSEDFISHYEMRTNGNTVKYSTDEIVPFFSVNPLTPIKGQSPLLPAKNRVLTEQYSSEYQRDFFNNSARPDGLFISEKPVAQKEKDETRKRWNDKFKGRGKTSQIAFLSGGIKYQQVSTTQREMDYIETLKFTRDDILVAFGIPRGLIVSEDANNADGENAMRGFLANTVEPEVKEIYNVINEMIIAPEFGEEYYLEYTSPVPEDRERLFKELELGVDKWITRNEARQMIGLPTLDGGDILLTSIGNVDVNSDYIQGGGMPTTNTLGLKVLNSRPSLNKKLGLIEDATKSITDAIAKAKATPKKKSKKKGDKVKGISLFSDPKLRANYELLVNKSIDRRAKTFKDRYIIEAQAQKDRVLAILPGLVERNVNTVSALTEAFNLGDEAKSTKDAMLPIYSTITEDAGTQAMRLVESKKAVDDFVMSAIVRGLIEDRAELFAKSVTETTFNNVVDSVITGINDGDGIIEIADRIEDIYDNVDTTRADLIARTETTYANNTGFQEAYSQSTVVDGKEWIATMDGRTRDAHRQLDGEIVKVNSTFSNRLPYPSEPNCRCVIAPAIITT